MTRPDDLQKEIREIENDESQRVKRNTQIESFELIPYQWLLAYLSGNSGALFVRAVLHELNINEHHVFQWRLEHKFKQYQVLNYYIPGCMPETLSFSKLLNQNNGVQNIKELFSKGFFLKATLGDASFSTNSWDKTKDFDQLSKLNTLSNDEYEHFMLQKKLPIQCEFRIHTFSKDIIPGLTYLVQGQKAAGSRNGAQEFVNKILNKLPDVILRGTFIGWDIALTPNNQYYIIEANFTGFHPEYRAGFQTTGYVDDHHYGPIICAWLNIYFKKNFRVYADAIDPALLLKYPFYRAFIFYNSLFRNEHIDLVKNQTNQTPLSAIIYLGNTDNQLMIYLIKHFLLVDFASGYYVISRDNCLSKVYNLFANNEQVKVCAESELFTDNQYQLIQQLGYDRRKQVCCYHAIRKFKNKHCMMF